MMAKQFNPDPSDLTHNTIQQLFYKQIRSLTARSNGTSQKMKTFDVQFSDAWF
jgi:hypothetical protein